MLKYALTRDAPVRPKALRFALLSPEEIERMAVVRVTETMLYYRGLPASGGLLDPLMGTVDRRHACALCVRGPTTCQGHPGYMALAWPVYHIGFIDSVLKILRTVCFGCARLVATPEDVQAILSSSTSAPLAALHGALRARRTCPHCGMPRPNITRASLGLKLTWPDDAEWECEAEQSFCAAPFTAREAWSVLSHVPDDDVRAMGYDPTRSHPKNMVTINLVVPPPCTRPAIYSSEGSRSRGQNELTVRFLEILKRSNEVQGTLDGVDWRVVDTPSDATLEALAKLQYEVFTLINSNARIHKPAGMGRNSSNANFKSLQERLKGKEGRVRGNLMGKRVDFSARCVITPDAYFDCDRVGVPYKIAKALTVPETVNSINIRALSLRVKRGAAHQHGAKTVIHRSGEVTDLESCATREDLILQCGDVVERHLDDDDVVVFNRQPSLHVHGMQAHRVRLMPGHTFRLSLVCASPYNADFDGDEMNLHVPQSKAASAECAALMGVAQNCVGAQSNKPVMGIVQDSLLGLHILTQSEVVLDRSHTCRLLGSMSHRADPERLPTPAMVIYDGTKTTKLWTGRQMVSETLPETLHIEADVASLDAADDTVVVRGGRLLSGVLRKAHVGTSAGGIVDVLCRELGGVACMRFMGDAQRLTHAYLLQRGHHVGIQDVMLSPEGHERVAERLSKATRLCEEIQREIVDAPASTAEVGERAILRLLSKTLQQTGGIVNECMASTNSIRRMVTAGSKGSFLNLSQICAALGQQSLEGGRIVAEKGTRTLPYFAHNDLSLASRGLVVNSFALGLSPTELFYHGVGGREGLVDTAVKTSQTGYLQRRMNKAMEDNSIYGDGTVRNSLGEIVCFRWGGDGLHPTKLERAPLRSLRDASIIDAMLPAEARVASECLARILLVKRTVLVDEVDARVLLPFHPKRAARELRRMARGTLTREEASRRVVELVDTLHRACTNTSGGGTDVLRLALLELAHGAACEGLDVDEHAAFLHRIEARVLGARAPPGESVGCIAAQSVGEPTTQLTLNSVDYQTHMAVCWTAGSPPPAPADGAIGVFVDALIASRPEACEVQADGVTVYLPLAAGTALALSPDEDGVMGWTELEAVTRHPPVNLDGSNTLVEVITESGRRVVATKAKSFLVERDGKLVCENGDAVRVGDRLPIAHHVPQGIAELDRASVDSSLSGIVKLDGDLGYMIGAYLARGQLVDETTVWIPGEPIRVEAWARRFDLVIDIERWGVRIVDTDLVRFLSAACGGDTRRVPGFALAAPDEFASALLDAFISVAAHVGRSFVTVSTTDRALRDGISLLLARFGRVSRLATHVVRRWRDDVRVEEEIYSLQMDATDGVSPADLADVRVDRVVSVREVPSSSTYVYDLTVRGTRNMLVTDGLGVRDTFHSAGSADKNVTLGIPRLKEIVDVSKAPKTPMTTLRLTTPTAADHMARTLPLTRLGDVVSACELVEWGTVADDRWIEQVDEALDQASDMPNTSRWIVRLTLQRDVMRTRYLDPPTLRRLLRDRLRGRAYVSSSETNAVEWIVRIRFRHVPEMMSVGGLSTDQEAILCHRAINVLQETMVVCGHPDVTDARVASDDPSAVHVYGTFFTDAVASDVVDWSRCVTNDLWEVYNTLGIEACVHLLFDQIKTVVSFDGMYVDDRHIMMIVDSMCRSGGMMPLNRHGINRTESSPLMRCSFEETTDVLCEAAAHAETENGQGISTCIMTGQLARVGTGSVTVSFPDESETIATLKHRGTILKSTCRSHRSTALREEIEYVMDESVVHPGAGGRSVSPEQASPRSKSGSVSVDVVDPPRKRARFRPVSPTR